MTHVPLTELERRCQKPDWRQVGNWMARHVSRPAALRVTRVVAPLGVSANVATLAAWGFGVAAAAGFAWGTAWGWMLGAVLLQLFYLLDHVDGQLARLRGTASLDGAQLDYLMHHTVNLLVPLGVGWGLFVKTAEPLWLAGSLLWGLALLLITLHHDARYKAFAQRLERVYGLLHVIGGGGQPCPQPPIPRRPIRLAAYAARKACEIHVILNALTLIALGQLLLGDTRLLAGAVYLAAMAPTAAAVAAWSIARSQYARAAEGEFAARYRVPGTENCGFRDQGPEAGVESSGFGVQGLQRPGFALPSPEPLTRLSHRPHARQDSVPLLRRSSAFGNSSALLALRQAVAYGANPQSPRPLVHVLILNHNGRHLMAECLPSVLRAADASRHACDVAVIDNDSTDDSLAWLAENFPLVRVIRRPNRGLCSFNDVVPELTGPVAVLLNNDVKLDPECIDPLVAPLLSPSRCFMTVPLCWRFDGKTYEGLKTAVDWHWGLVRATAFYPGHEKTIHRPGLTASAGSVLAVDCCTFGRLGGFDPLYLPGRLEDLDFAFRGYRAGYHARYVPTAVAYHRGMATFRRVYGTAGCDRLALRNTLLFQWKNLRCPSHVLRQLLGLPLRLALDVCRAPWVSRQRRWTFARALLAALARLPRLASTAHRVNGHRGRLVRPCTAGGQRRFFDRFHPQQIDVTTAKPTPSNPTITAVIIALDEAGNLAELLPMLDWADEIVVVDGGSRDDTVSIARRHGCRVASRRFDTFAGQRNHALRLATGDWVFSIDADERPTPRLVAEIRRAVAGCRQSAFRVPIRSLIFGRPIRRCGTQDDCPVRLLRRSTSRWIGDVHEVVQVTGQVGRLGSWLTHRTLPDLESFLAKMHRYTLLAARARRASGWRPRWRDTWIAPPREVFRRLFWKLGLLDGPAGWAFGLLSGLSEWALARRHRQLSQPPPARKVRSPKTIGRKKAFQDAVGATAGLSSSAENRRTWATDALLDKPAVAPRPQHRLG